MTPARTRPTRTGRDVLRGLTAAAALLAFIAGAPTALVGLAPLYLPDQAPTGGQAWHALTSPDNGSLLLLALAAVAWLTWSAFTTSVVVELIAAARQLRAPALPLLGGFQRAAAGLLATAGVLLAVSGNITLTATPATASALVIPLAPQPAQAPPSAAFAEARPPARATASEAPAPTSHLPSVVVQRGDTLWDLAERHLGSGQRYTEIADLNHDRVQPDGRRLVDSDWILPGWTLLLPADATDLAAAPAGDGSGDVAQADAGDAGDIGDGGSTVVVQPGDTLWQIAADHLGDGQLYPQIAALNQDRPQPDGQRLTDPDLIRPGWVLDLPTPAAATPTPPPQQPPPAPATPNPHPNREPSTADPVPPTVEPEQDEPTTATPSPAAGETAVAEAGHTSTTPWFLGLAALGAAGVVGEITRRRHLQQRVRRVGETIPLPDPTSPAAAAERTLRSALTPVSIAAISTTLTNLASRCFAANLPLPRVGALLLDEHHLTLILTTDAPEAVEPFTAADPRTWLADTADVAAEQPVDDPEQPVPYPLLVTLGHTADATLVLNLEAAGTLSVMGDDEAANDLLRALVLEVATSDLSGQLPVRVNQELADLADAFESFRLHAAQPEEDRGQIEADITELLASSHLGNTLEARSRRLLPDTWPPVVHVEPALQSAASRPWSGVVTITRTDPPDAWAIRTNATGTARLEPLGLDFQPQRLSAAHLDDLRAVLHTAVPPEATRPTTGQHESLAGDLAAVQAAHPPHPPADGLQVEVSIDLLGPIQIHGLTTGAPTSRMTELLVYLALHGPATGADLDEVLWQGERVNTNTRNVFIHRARDRVGTSVLPLVGADGRFRIGEAVTTDWARFQQTLAEGATLNGEDRIARLSAALALVRDRPFRGIGPEEYAWADYDIQQMTAAIADTASLLARLLHEAGRDREALDAATHGLLAEPYSEPLQRVAVTATAALAGPDEARALHRRYAAALARLDPELA